MTFRVTIGEAFIDDLTPNERAMKKVGQWKNGELIAIYPSITAAEKATHIYHIGECANGKRKSAGGYQWKFMEDKD